MPSLGQLIYSLHDDEKKIIRKLEKVLYKKNSCRVAILFNEICLKEGLYPNYTRLHLHNPSWQNNSNITTFRKELIERQLIEKKHTYEQIEIELSELTQLWNDIPNSNSHLIQHELQHLVDNDYKNKERGILSKISNLNGGNVKTPKEIQAFVNLSEYEPTPEERKLLNLGLNCHYIKKPDPLKKRLEIEVLLDNVLQLESSGKVQVSDSLQHELIAESNKNRGPYRSQLVNREMKDTAKKLRENNGITIRRADKTAAFVLLPTEIYHQKLENILNDESKFKKIRKNPIEDIKRDLNAVIKEVNEAPGNIRLPEVKGDYEPGYIYGNIKTHKNGNPLRPIISQIPTPTYKVAKRLNTLLTPYVPDKYCLKSSADFLQSIRNSSPEGNIASMDVENLFTNVPVRETIDMIIDRVYHNDSTPDLDIPELALRTLLEICTMRSPFTDHNGQLYTQVDGIAMGSPLGVLFANFYMGTIEEKVFSTIPRPCLYFRYIDDTFVAVHSEEELEQLIREFENHSSLKFTFESNNNGKLPFLDVLVTTEENRYTTTVYTKPTNEGLCLNGRSECPKRYLNSVIDAYARRALSHCTTWQDTHQELDRASQVLANNGFKDCDVNQRFKRAIDRWYNDQDNPIPNENPKGQIKIFYGAIMHSNYREEEKAMKNIIKRNVKPVEDNTEIDLVIYYKNNKTKNLIMKNNPRPINDEMKRHNVVYHFQCPVGGCCPHTYVGRTTTRLSKRLSCHLQEGAIFNHFMQEHGRRPSRNEVTGNTKILYNAPDVCRLSFMEALLIYVKKPTLNTTNEILLLPSLKNRIEVGRSNIQNNPIVLLENNDQIMNNNHENRPNASSNITSTTTHPYILRSRTRHNL